MFNHFSALMSWPLFISHCLQLPIECEQPSLLKFSNRCHIHFVSSFWNSRSTIPKWNDCGEHITRCMRLLLTLIRYLLPARPFAVFFSLSLSVAHRMLNRKGRVHSCRAKPHQLVHKQIRIPFIFAMIFIWILGWNGTAENRFCVIESTWHEINPELDPPNTEWPCVCVCIQRLAKYIQCPFECRPSVWNKWAWIYSSHYPAQSDYLCYCIFGLLLFELLGLNNANIQCRTRWIRYIHIYDCMCVCVCAVYAQLNVTFLVFEFYTHGDWYRNERFWLSRTLFFGWADGDLMWLHEQPSVCKIWNNMRTKRVYRLLTVHIALLWSGLP